MVAEQGVHVRLMDLRAGEPDPTAPEDRRQWYSILLTQAQKDKTLAMQLDVGPPPGTQQDVDRVIPRICRLFLTFDPGRGKSPFCGVAGYFHPFNTGTVQYRPKLFASVVPMVSGEVGERDVETLAEAYRQLAEYVLDAARVASVEVHVISGAHEKALRRADFEEVCRIQDGVQVANRPNRGAPRLMDVLVFVKGTHHGSSE